MTSGYGAEPADAGATWRAVVSARDRRPVRWTIPSGDRLACWIVLNLEAFDPLSRIDGGAVAPDFPALAQREYGNRVGFWRLRRLLQDHQVPASAAVNSAFFREWPQLADAVVQDGWDVMGHGEFNNRKLTTYDQAAEEDAIARVLADLSAVTGSPVAGWLSPGLVQSPNTTSILAKLGIEYVADIIADDVPFVLGLESGSMVSVPYSMENNDKGAYGRRNMTPEAFSRSVLAAFEQLYAEASPEEPKVMCVAVHPYLSGAPHRVAALREVISTIAARPGVRWCTGVEINRWFRDAAGGSPTV